MGVGSNCNTKLFGVLWAYRIVYKVTIGHTTFQLVYGQEAILSIELELPSLRIALHEILPLNDSLMDQYIQLEKLDEVCCCALQNIEVAQRQWKDDSQLKPKLFKLKDIVLLCDSRFQKNLGMLKMRWLGPFRVLEFFSNGSIQLAITSLH
jgi:hypothetical protein